MISLVDDKIKRGFDTVLGESDLERRIALARRLRADIWDMLGEDERGKLQEAGLDIGKLRGVLRIAK